MVTQHTNNVSVQLNIFDADIMYFDVTIGNTSYIIDCTENTFTLYHNMDYEYTLSDSESDNEYENLIREMPPLKEWEFVISISKIPNTEIHLYENCDIPYFTVKLDNGSVSTRITEDNAKYIHEQIKKILEKESEYNSIQRIEVTDVNAENQARQHNLHFLERWPKYECDVDCYQRV